MGHIIICIQVVLCFMSDSMYTYRGREWAPFVFFQYYRPNVRNTAIRTAPKESWTFITHSKSMHSMKKPFIISKTMFVTLRLFNSSLSHNISCAWIKHISPFCVWMHTFPRRLLSSITHKTDTEWNWYERYDHKGSIQCCSWRNEADAACRFNSAVVLTICNRIETISSEQYVWLAHRHRFHRRCSFGRLLCVSLERLQPHRNELYDSVWLELLTRLVLFLSSRVNLNEFLLVYLACRVVVKKIQVIDFGRAFSHKSK